MFEHLRRHIPKRIEEEQEHVDGKEHADNAAQDPHQVEVEEALIFFDLFPRTEYRQHTEQTGQHDHQQRQPVNGEMDRDTKTRDPRHVEFRLPLRNSGGLRQ